jgi:hypothetical protein
MTDLVSLFVDRLVDRTDAHWRLAVANHGLGRTWKPLSAAAGGAIAGLKVAAKAVNGNIPVGLKIDPQTKQGLGWLLLPPRNSWAIIGVPDSGKTSRIIAPGVVWELAAGNNVVLVTPQHNTVNAVWRLAEVMTGGNITVIDFGHTLVKEGSPYFTSCDLTRGCTDLTKATEFAEKFFGERSPFRLDLKQGSTYWGQVIEKMAVPAAYLTALQRSVVAQRYRDGLLPNGDNGMRHVMNLMIEEPRLRTELTEAEVAEVVNAGEDPAKLLRDMARARTYAQQFHESVQQMAYDAALMSRQGVQVDPAATHAYFKRVTKMLNEYSGSHNKTTPQAQLAESAMTAFVETELRVASPMPGDNEITPEQIASARGGLTIITYAMVGKPGVIACVLADQIVAAAYANSTDTQIAQRIASVEAAPQMTIWLDEADALAGLSKMDNLLNIVTQGRQLGVAGRFAMVSKPLAVQKLGAEAASTLLESVPVTWYLTPSGRELEELAREFGMQELLKITRAVTSQSIGPVQQWTRTTTPQQELILKPDDVLNLPQGTVIVRNRPGKPGERIMLVAVPDRCYEPDPRFGEVRVGQNDAAILVDEVTIVMDAMNEAIERDLPGAPWAAMRPDLAAKYADEPEPADAAALLGLPRPTVLV